MEPGGLTQSGTVKAVYHDSPRVKYGPQQQHTARLRYLPAQLEAARHKVRALENEARRYGLADLLEPCCAVCGK